MTVQLTAGFQSTAPPEPDEEKRLAVTSSVGS